MKVPLVKSHCHCDMQHSANNGIPCMTHSYKAADRGGCYHVQGTPVMMEEGEESAV